MGKIIKNGIEYSYSPLSNAAGLPTDGTICWSGWQSSHNDGSSYITGNVRAQFHADSNGIYIAGYSNSNSRAAYKSLSFVKLYGIKSNMNWH